MDSKHGSKIHDNHSRRNAKANGNKGDVLAAQDLPANPEHEKGDIRHARRDLESTVSPSIFTPTKKLKSSSLGSPSSPDYSSEDFIQDDSKMIFKSTTSTTAAPNVVRPLPKYYKIDVSDDIFSKSEHDSGSFSCCTSQVSDVTHESLLHNTSLTESPHIQVMEGHADFVSNRISTSIFASKSPTPTEWSITSNESLFSIHIGNTSFTRDQILKLSGELRKSGELQKFEESYKSSELFSLSSPPPTIRGRESERKNMNIGRNFGEIGVVDQKIKDTPMEATNDQCKEKLPTQDLSFNCHKGTYSQSLTFPKKKKLGRSLCCCFTCNYGFSCSTRPSCNCCKQPSCMCCKLLSCNYCCKWWNCSCCKWPSCSCFICSSYSCCKLPSSSNCRWLNCNCCKWPSCSCCLWPGYNCFKWPSCRCYSGSSCTCCKWPSNSCCTRPSYNCSSCCKWSSCSSCSWIFCCGWNSRRKRIFCCSSKNMTEGEPMQQYSEPKVSKVTPKPAYKKWFSCFFCCSNSY